MWSEVSSASVLTHVRPPDLLIADMTIRYLNSNESVNIYLADLHRLSTLSGRVSDCGLARIDTITTLKWHPYHADWSHMVLQQRNTDMYCFPWHSEFQSDNGSKSTQCASRSMAHHIFCEKSLSFHDKAMVKLTCVECTTIDPVPFCWKKSKFWVNSTWYRLGMDIMHYCGSHYLTLTDCYPLCFSLWWLLHCQDSLSIVHQLESVFYKRGLPHEILTDNDITFCSR